MVFQVALGALVAVCVAAIAGCQDPGLGQAERSAASMTPAGPASKTGDLIGILADPSTPDATRIHADTKLKAAGKTHNADRLLVLEQIVYAPGNDAAMRIYALDQLEKDDRGRAVKTLARYLPQMNNWRVLQHACAMAGRLKDPRLIDALARSLDRQAKTLALPSRPEAVALPKITGKPLVPSLASVLLHGRDTGARIAALDVIRKLRGPAYLRALIGKSRHGGVLMVDLRWWNRRFHAVPAGKTEVMWIQTLHQPKYARTTRRAARAAAVLRKRRGFEMAPRYVNLLACIPPGALTMPRALVLSRLRKALARRRHVQRRAAYPGSPSDIAPTLAANASKLTLGDLLILRQAQRGLNRPRLLRRIYRWGLRDMSDTKTEYGGLLYLRPSGAGAGCALSARLYPPLYTGNDRVYVTGGPLMLATCRGVAQFILHFQRVHNGKYVGPAAPDLAYVRGARCDAVVFTSIGPRQFDATFYTPTRAVIDLGVYRVPG